MFRRIALASAVILGSFSFATVAQANVSETINFEASVEFECAFTNTVDGVLGYDDFVTLELSSEQGDGAAGSTNLLCNGDADLLKEAGQTSGPALDAPVEYVVNVSPDGVEAGTDTELTVDLAVTSGEIIEPADYVFFVTLTAVQQ